MKLRIAALALFVGIAGLMFYVLQRNARVLESRVHLKVVKFLDGGTNGATFSVPLGSVVEAEARRVLVKAGVRVRMLPRQSITVGPGHNLVVGLTVDPSLRLCQYRLVDKAGEEVPSQSFSTLGFGVYKTAPWATNGAVFRLQGRDVPPEGMSVRPGDNKPQCMYWPWTNAVDLVEVKWR